MDVAGPILVCAGDLATSDDVGPPLAQAGYIVHRQHLSAEMTFAERPALLMVDARRPEGDALLCCRRFRSRPGDRSVPMLFVLGDSSPAARLAALDAGSDAYLLRPFAARELVARTEALLHSHRLENQLAEKAAEAQQTCQRLRQAYRQIDQDLAAVWQIQRSFLPRTLPELPGMTLAAHHHPCGQVGGDSYDAFRLDERHVGFYVADALGHGTAAGLLTMFLQRAVRGKDISADGYRLVPPDEVLRRINRELMEQALADVPFVTMVYVQYDRLDRVLRFARAGHPHPVFVPHDGVPELWTSPGNLLGVFSTDFEVQTRTLRPGDKVFLYSDGLGLADANLLLECAARHRALPIQQQVERLAGDLLTQASPTDDFTLLGLEVSAA